MGTSDERRAKLFSNGGNRAIRIPKDFDPEGDEVVIRREGDRLVIEPVRKGRLLELLDTLDPLDETFPDIDEGLLPLDDPGL